MKALTPPSNTEVEQAILGTMLLVEKSTPEVLSRLEADDFHKEQHQIIFSAVTSLFSEGKAVDMMTVVNKLTNDGTLETAGGVGLLAALTDAIPSMSTLPDYCRIVKDLKKSRELITLSTESLGRCYDNENITDILDDFGQRFFDLAADKKEGASFVSSATDNLIAELKARCESDDSITGIPTGFTELDSLLAGLQKTDLIVLAGRPSMGKTAVAMNMVRHAAVQGYRPLVFSLEMSKEKLIERMLADVSGVSSNEIRKGYLNDSTWPKITMGKQIIDSLPILIDDSPALSIVEIRARAKMAAVRHGVDLIMVDYMQLAHSRGAANREREIAQISAGLKGLAKELQVPVIALSQLNRSLEQRTDKRPIMADLRDSGSIEQDADVICFVYRDEVYNKEDDNPQKGIAELIIAKQRNGSIGTVKLAFLGEYSRFTELETRFGEEH